MSEDNQDDLFPLPPGWTIKPVGEFPVTAYEVFEGEELVARIQVESRTVAQVMAHALRMLHIIQGMGAWSKAFVERSEGADYAPVPRAMLARINYDCARLHSLITGCEWPGVPRVLQEAASQPPCDCPDCEQQEKIANSLETQIGLNEPERDEMLFLVPGSTRLN